MLDERISFTEVLFGYMTRKERVTVFMLNGFQMKGFITRVYLDGAFQLTELDGSVDEIPGGVYSTVKK